MHEKTAENSIAPTVSFTLHMKVVQKASGGFGPGCVMVNFSRTVAFFALIAAITVVNADYELITKGDVWKYKDDGGDWITANYQLPSFDDSAWPSGPGPFGFDFKDLNTIIQFGSNASDKYISTYFRKSVTVWDDASLAAPLNVTFQEVHGARCFLNGAEIFRKNLGSGSVNFKTQASTGISKTSQQMAYWNATATDIRLTAGVNVFACNVHLANIFSSSMRFDAQVIVFGADVPSPSPSPLPPSASSTPLPSSETPTVSPTISNTGSVSPTISVTASVTATRSFSSTKSFSKSISTTASVSTPETQSNSASISVTLSESSSLSLSSSVTPTISETASVTPTISESSSVTPTISLTSSVTPTISVTSSVTPSLSYTPSVSLSPSSSVCPCSCENQVCCSSTALANLTCISLSVDHKSGDAAIVTIGAAAGGGCVGVAVLAIVVVMVMRKRRASANKSEVKTLASVTSPQSQAQTPEATSQVEQSQQKPHRKKKRDAQAFAPKDTEGPQVITTALDDDDGAVTEVVVDAVDANDVRLSSGTPWPGKTSDSKAPRRKKIKKMKKKGSKSGGNDGSEDGTHGGDSDERKTILPDEAM